MTAQLENSIPDVKDMTAEEMAQSIRDFCREALAVLNERRDAQHDSETSALDVEREALEQEHASLGESVASLQTLLPAKQRLAQYEIDTLTVAGQHEEARSRLAELEQAQQIPVSMKQRQQAISDRIEAIEAQKRTALLRGAQDFYRDSIELIRGSETALASILDATMDTLNILEMQTGATLYIPENLTADERTTEWGTLHRLYCGRVR